MLIHSASQLLTLAGGPQRGETLGSLGIIADGAVLVREGAILAVGSSAELRAAYPDEPGLDAGGCVVMPGFVDPHTHLIWAGDRAAEFEMRLEGKTYLEILAAGGGILSTVRATREAHRWSSCMAETRPRLQRMLRHGTTTAEAKTGYGLETAAELRMLQALLALDRKARSTWRSPSWARTPSPRVQGPSGRLHRPDLCHEMLPAAMRLVAGPRPRPPAALCGRFLRDRRLQPGAVAPDLEHRPRRWASRSRSTRMSSTTWAAPAWRPSWARPRPTTW